MYFSDLLGQLIVEHQDNEAIVRCGTDALRSLRPLQDHDQQHSREILNPHTGSWGIGWG